MTYVSNKDLIEKMRPFVDELGGGDVSTPDETTPDCSCTEAASQCPSESVNAAKNPRSITLLAGVQIDLVHVLLQAVVRRGLVFGNSQVG